MTVLLSRTRRASSAAGLAALLSLLLGCSRETAHMESPLANQSEPLLSKQSQSALVGAAAAQARPALERQLIRTVTLELEVESLASARQRAEALTTEAGGFVETLDGARYEKTQHLNLRLRIPKEGLDRALRAARKLGRVNREHQQVEDVTRKYVDVDARLRNMQHTEQRLLSLLDAAQGALADVLAVERELARVREESEVLDAQLRTLKEQVALSTLELRLAQQADAEVPDSMLAPFRRLGRNAGAILGESFGALLGFGAGLLSVLLYLLPWIPVLAVGGYLLRRLWRWRRARRRSPPATTAP